MYEVMRYWDEDLTEWGAEERDFAVAWRSQPKWVVSRSLHEASVSNIFASCQRSDIVVIGPLIDRRNEITWEAGAHDGSRPPGFAGESLKFINKAG